MNLIDHALLAAAETEKMRDMDLFRQTRSSSYHLQFRDHLALSLSSPSSQR
jgi:hypothetical protein